ncbi:MAG: hypothetical protein WBA05_15480 [Gordonia sp. (in: high G+C Gram-positive bacteria)]|uniref:hypothetical protein n=1 Tax=Gordonia TaxID=2053 RepID=UPI0032632366
MSYTLAFWSGADAADCADTYIRLNKGEPVDGVRPVDAAAVERAMAGLADWSRSGTMLYPPGGTSADGPVFDVFIDTHAVVYTGYSVAPQHLNEVIDLMRALGFRLYDPQRMERFE